MNRAPLLPVLAEAPMVNAALAARRYEVQVLAEVLRKSARPARRKPRGSGEGRP